MLSADGGFWAEMEKGSWASSGLHLSLGLTFPHLARVLFQGQNLMSPVNAANTWWPLPEGQALCWAREHNDEEDTPSLRACHRRQDISRQLQESLSL